MVLVHLADPNITPNFQVRRSASVAPLWHENERRRGLPDEAVVVDRCVRKRIGERTEPVMYNVACGPVDRRVYHRVSTPVRGPLCNVIDPSFGLCVLSLLRLLWHSLCAAERRAVGGEQMSVKCSIEMNILSQKNGI